MRRLICGLVLAMAALADARTPTAAPRQPIVLRLEGHFTPDRDTARARGTDAISLRVGTVERWFAVDTARNMSALSSLDGRDVLAALAPFHPTLMAVGDARLRQRLVGAPVGAPVRVEGLVDRGSRSYLLRDVAVAMPPKVPAP